MANLITGSRIVFSIVLIFVPVFSSLFYIIYVLAGLSDMLDGYVARKFGTESEKGSTFDTVADICFVGVVAYKILPVIILPLWLGIWIGVIAMIKLINIAYVLAVYRKMIAMHTIMNKVTGTILFLFPFLIRYLSIGAFGLVACLMATIATIQETREFYKLNENEQMCKRKNT